MKCLHRFDLPLILGFAAAVVMYAWAWDVRHIAGIALAAIGSALWFTARLQLGTSFAVLPKAKALVTTGLYSKFRNPVYLFGGLAYAGLFIAWGQSRALGRLSCPVSGLPVLPSQKRGAGPRKGVRG